MVEDLGLHVRYFTEVSPLLDPDWKFAKFKTVEYYKDSPFTMEVQFDPLYPAKLCPEFIEVKFVVEDKDSFRIRSVRTAGASGEEADVDQKASHAWGTPLSFDGFVITLNAADVQLMKPGAKFRATWGKPYTVGAAFQKNLTAFVESGVIGKNSKTDVISLTMKDSKPERADDILNALIEKYNDEAREYKNASVLSTIEFIDTRLETISEELGKVESNYRNYQTSRTLVNIEAQSQLTLTSDMQYENQLTEIRLQQSILKMIKEDLNHMKEGEYKVIPSNIGLSDAGLNQVISNYNTLVAERNRLVANSSTSNPRVRNVDLQLSDGRNAIVLSIANLEKVYSIREQEINDVLRKSKAKMSSIPTQQFDLTQIARKQQIIEPLYLLLQQRREEAQISMYSVTDKARIIEASYGSSVPIEPKSRVILLLAMILGCCIPPVAVWLWGVMKYKVETREDIEKVLDNPILAIVPFTDDRGTLRSSGGRDVKSESFRMLRSNLQFSQGRVLQVTSSVPGEGKSFIAANLAVSLTHIGKKVIVVGMDLRKPRLVEFFPEVASHKSASVVSYLIGKLDHPSQTVIHSEQFQFLDIAYSGVIPPNPSELLSTDRLKELIDYYRGQYDYVVLDTAPMMPVSDSVLINRFVDITLYIIRSNYTGMKMLQEISRLFKQMEIKSPKLILNGMDLESKILRYGYGQYGYGSGYGSGYGYGYGYGYGDAEGNRTSDGTWFSHLGGRFKKK